MRPLMWFRADLRVEDNTALHHACADADAGVVAVSAICPDQWREHDWGGPKVDFVLRNLAMLSAKLAKLEIPLLLINLPRFDQVPAALLELAQRHTCDALYHNEEYEVNELRRDQAAATLFAQHGLAVRAFVDQVIVDVRGVRTGSGGWYQVFTPFKRAWLRRAQEDGPPAICPRPKRQKRLDIAPHAVPESLSGFDSPQRTDLWPAGESAAGARLEAFVDRHVDDYADTRDLPAIDGTSALSPYLAAGVLSPRQCLHAALAVNRNRLDSGKLGVTTWINELIWREFYRHVLVGFPHVCKGRPFKRATDALPWAYDEDLFTAWCAGRTGFPIVDAGMRQLAETGWMHNRLRMIVAMFLTKDLFIDWRWGERHFMRHLVDADFASNNGGWQWSASTGTDAAPYFRIYNPHSQSKRFDPEGLFIRRFVPELATAPTVALHEPHHPALRDAYPDPIVDRQRTRARVIAAFRGVLAGPRQRA